MYVPRGWHRQVMSKWREGRKKHDDVQLEFNYAKAAILFKGPEDQIAAAKVTLSQMTGFADVDTLFSSEPLECRKFEIEGHEIGKLCGRGGRVVSTMAKKAGVGVRFPRKGETPEITWIEGTPAHIDSYLAEASMLIDRKLEEPDSNSWAKLAGGGTSSKAVAMPTKPAVSAEHTKIMECLFFENNARQDRYDLNMFLQYLASGNKSLDICVFTITYNKIVDVILREFRDGVKVRIISDNDKAHDKGSDIYRLAQAGIPIKTDLTEAHMHHKFAVIDGKLVMNGSFNWTMSAQSRNFENVVISNDTEMAKEFQRHFDHLWNSDSMGILQ